MLKKVIKSFYYSLYSILLSRFLLLNIKKNKVIIFDKKKFKFFYQNIRNEHDLNTYRQIFIKQEYSFNKNVNKKIINKYKSLISSNKKPLIIDCGANIGASTNYLNIIFPKSKIIAIEPDKKNTELFKKNKLSGNIYLYEKALSSEKIFYDIQRPKNYDWRSSTIKKINKNYINENTNISITVKEIFEKFNVNEFTPFLIKIDIEGHEKELFKKNIEWVKEFNFLIIELHDWLIPNKNISLNFNEVISLIDNETFTFGENTVVINKSK